MINQSLTSLRGMQDYSANETSPAFGPANQAYRTYVGNANYDAQKPDQNYYDFRCVALLKPRCLAPLSTEPLVTVKVVAVDSPDIRICSVGDSAFFVWDTRRYRSDNALEDTDDKTMLGQEQREAFFDWVSRVRPGLVTSDALWRRVVAAKNLATPLHGCAEG